MSTLTMSDIRKEAVRLAREHKDAEPGLERVDWFPNDSEARVVGIGHDLIASPSGRVEPFYFDASPADDLPAPCAVALIRSDESGRLDLPEGWGEWSEAEELEV